MAEAVAVEENGWYTATEYEVVVICVGGMVEGKPFESYYTDTNGTPNTAQMYVSMMTEKCERPLEDVISNTDDYMYLDIMVDGANLRGEDGNYIYTASQYYYFYEDAADSSDGWERVRDELIENADKPVDISKPFFNVHISGTDADGYEYFEQTYYVQASEIDSVLLDWQM